MKRTQLLLGTTLLLFLFGCNSSSLNFPKKETSEVTFFPTKNREENANSVMMESRLSGILKRDNQGCLRVNGDLIIWPYNATLKDNIIYDKSRNVIAKIGDIVTLGGAGFSREENSVKDLKRVSSYLPSSQCSDPYFFVDSVVLSNPSH